MSKYEGLYTFDVDNHRYIPIGQADGIIDTMDYEPKPAEPLIKDEKIRKAVRAWAEACDVERAYLRLENEKGSTFCVYTFQFNCNFIQIATHDQDPIEGGRTYAIAELCGEEEAKDNE